MGRKVIHISLPDEDFYRIKEKAKLEHLKISTLAKQIILKVINKKDKG